MIFILIIIAILLGLALYLLSDISSNISGREAALGSSIDGATDLAGDAIISLRDLVPGKESSLDRGIDLYRNGMYLESIGAFDDALAEDPSDSLAWCFKGLAFLAMDRYDEGLACLNRSLELDPQDADGWYEMGKVFASMEKHNEALYCYENALAIDPSFGEAWSDKGCTLQALGRESEAREAFSRAEQLLGWSNPLNSTTTVIPSDRLQEPRTPVEHPDPNPAADILEPAPQTTAPFELEGVANPEVNDQPGKDSAGDTLPETYHDSSSADRELVAEYIRSLGYPGTVEEFYEEFNCTDVAGEVICDPNGWE